MVLQEVDVCPLPETPKFTSPVIIRSRDLEKQQKCPNEFSNLE